MTLIVDTCFWLGLVDSRDQYHETSLSIVDLLDGNNIIFPWPCLYETISTQLSKRKNQLVLLRNILSKDYITRLSDEKYKENALQEVFLLNRKEGTKYSLVDCVIREMLKDDQLRINGLISYNVRDFVDLCNKRRIQIIDRYDRSKIVNISK